MNPTAGLTLFIHPGNYGKRQYNLQNVMNTNQVVQQAIN